MTPLHRPQDMALRLQEGDVALAALLIQHAGMHWGTHFVRSTVFGTGEASVLGLALDAPTPALLDFLRTTPAPDMHHLVEMLNCASTDPLTGNRSRSRETRTAAHLALAGCRTDAVLWTLDAYSSLQGTQFSANNHLNPCRWLHAWAASWTQGAPLPLGKLLHERLRIKTEDWMTVEVGTEHSHRSGRWFRGWTGETPLPFAFAWSLVEPGEAVAGWLVDEIGLDPGSTVGWEGTPQASWLEVAAFNRNWGTVVALLSRGAQWSERAVGAVKNARDELLEDLRQERGDHQEKRERQVELAQLESWLLGEDPVLRNTQMARLRARM